MFAVLPALCFEQSNSTLAAGRLTSGAYFVSRTEIIPDEPMQIQRVRARGPSCEPDCPEWISATGFIKKGAAARLREVINSLGGRRLPVLVNSQGGVVDDAIAMGRLLRQMRISVVVAATDMAPCPTTGGPCKEPRASTSPFAVCASACVFVLAGGERRYVSKVDYLGVHQAMVPTTMIKRTYRITYKIVNGRKIEVSRTLIRVRELPKVHYKPASAKMNNAVASYLVEMGVDKSLMKWIVETPAASLHQLTLEELRATRLATHLLYGVTPIYEGLGLNGLEAENLSGQGGDADFIATGTAKAPSPSIGGTIKIAIALRYRPGGGNARVELAQRESAEAGDLAISSVRWPSDGAEFHASPQEARGVLVPAPSLCRARAADAPAVLTLARTPNAALTAMLNINALDGGNALFEQVCPSVGKATK